MYRERNMSHTNTTLLPTLYLYQDTLKGVYRVGGPLKGTGNRVGDSSALVPATIPLEGVPLRWVVAGGR